MTIAAGFKCMDGVVLCADSQVSYGDLMKFPTQKLFLLDRQWGQVGLAGSGEIGDIIDTIQQQIFEAIEREHETPEKVRREIKRVLLDIYRNELAVFPAEDEDEKTVELLIGIRIGKAQPELFKSYSTLVRRMNGYSVIGTGVLVKYIADNFYWEGFTVAQAILLSVCLLVVAKRYIQTIGGESNIVALTPEGGHIWPVWKIVQKERYFDEFFKIVRGLMFACADTTRNTKEFNDGVEVAMQQLKAIRNEQITGENTMASLMREALRMFDPDQPIPKESDNPYLSR
jgi:hypothetical protein